MTTAAEPAPRTRRRDPDDKRDRITAAARDLFAERGFADTPTADIAQRAGVSEGLVFHYFGSKRELFAGVAADYGRRLAEAMFGPEPGRSDVPPHRAIEQAFAFVRRHRSLHRLLVNREPELGRDGTRQEIVGALEAELRSLAGSGRLRPLHPRPVAELLFALVGAALEACFVDGDGSDEALYLSETIQCVVGALAPSLSFSVPTTEPTTSDDEE